MIDYADMIHLIAEHLTNEFPGMVIPDLIEKSQRLYAVMKLQAPVEDHEEILSDLKQILNYKHESNRLPPEQYDAR